ncbi:MAG: glycosyltransferase family 2 protein, partial [Methanococcaceae archaeon]
MNYVIITPMKNEGCFIERTIRSVCSQTVKPVCWMIVDDGSTDNSPEIVKKYKNNFSFIEYIKLSDMYLSEYSSRIAHIVNFGTRILEKKNILYEVIVKLDA